MTAATVGLWLQRIGRVVRRPHTALQERRAIIEQRRRIGEHPLFASCSRSELVTLIRWGEELTVPAGVTLMREHAIAGYLVAVLDGALGRSTTAGSLDPVDRGGWLGANEVLAFAPEPATVATATDCRLFILGARPVLTFAPRMRGLRATLFPSLDERAATLRIRELRADGLAQWRKLRREPPDVQQPSASIPPWLRVYRSTAAPSEAGFAQLWAPRRDGDVTRPAPTPPTPLRIGRAAAIAAVVLASTGGVVGSTVRIPYHAVRGSVVSASDAVRVDPADEAGGEILFPVIDVAQVTPLRALEAWHAPDADVRSTDELLGGRTAADMDRANRQLMTTAKQNAVAAVTHLLPELHLDEHDVSIDAGRIGGPSGGLAFALALVDERTPGDLTDGRTVAATGAIDGDGVVYDVAGIRLKTLAARRAGSSILVLPRANVDEARPVAGSLVLIGVESVAEAVQKLVAAGGSMALG